MQHGYSNRYQTLATDWQ